MSQHLPVQRNLMRHMRALLLHTFLATAVFFVPFTKAHAQADAAATARLDCYKRSMPSMNCIFEAISNSQQTGQGNQEKFTMYSVGLMAGALGYGFAGASSTEEAGIDPTKPGADAGAITVLGRGMAFLYEKPPASLGDYVADLIQNNNLVRPVYAQGVGFQSLSNILPIWKTFRDIAYLLLTLIFFFIGFFIIFRQKLDGHTVANISNAIPNVIIALVLITFSYAIAGFMIDLMYLVIYFLIWIAGQIIRDPISIYTDTTGNFELRLETIALNQNLFSSGLNLIFGTGSSSEGIGNSASAVGAIVYSIFDPASVGSLIAGLTGPVAQVIAFAVFAVALFFAVMRTFFALIKSYISFIIAVIFSPIQLLMGAIAGRSTFVNWIKTLAANLAPFPLVIGLIFLSMALTGFARNESVGYRGSASSTGFNPPLLPFTYSTAGATATAIQGIIGFGILMFMPEAVKMSNEFFKVSGGPNLGAVAEGLKSGWKGGEIIPGLGIKAPGAPTLLKGAARIGGSAIAGTVAGASKAGRANQRIRDQGGDKGFGGFVRQAGRFIGSTASGLAIGTGAGVTATTMGGYRAGAQKVLTLGDKIIKGDETITKASTIYRRFKSGNTITGSATQGTTAQPQTTASTGTKRKPTT